jgi:Ubiquitin carboxyl-terminal hydrolase/Domain of unknown function (DUF4157)
MNDRASRKDPSTHEASAVAQLPSLAPGKRSAVESAYGAVVQRKASRFEGGDGGSVGRMGDWSMSDSMLSAMGLGSVGAVQRKAGGASEGGANEASAAEVADVGARGIGGAVSAMPYAETIQRSFGRHDISGISAHLGEDAAAANRTLGAEAYATGNHVAFGKAPSLHTAAHEAAHVVQQRSGLSFKGGVGQEGDSHEQHADAVADAVVAGRSAEGLLDAYAPSGFSAGASSGAMTGPIQKKPVPDKGKGKDDEDDKRHFHDDKHPKLKLLKEGGKDNEFRLKDRVQHVFWKEESLYFIDVEMNQPLDLGQFEATREFGSFLETYKEATKLESEGGEGHEGAEMHLLQQFFSNALFDTSEVARFDYQASPLNYQVEHSYIRAAATSNVDVMKDQLLGEDYGLDTSIIDDKKRKEEQEKQKDKVYLSSQMDFRDTMHQMFRAIVVAEEPNDDNVVDALEPLSEAVAKHVDLRFKKKQEFQKENELEKAPLVLEKKELDKKIQQLESAMKGQKRGTLDGEDQQTFDWIENKEKYLKSQGEIDKLGDKRATLESQIEEQKKLIGVWTKPIVDPNAKKDKKDKNSKEPKVQTKSPEETILGLEKALGGLKEDEKRKALAELAEKLGFLDGSLGKLSGDELGKHLEEAQLKKVTERAEQGSAYGQRFLDLPKRKEERAVLQEKIQKIEARSFDLMRDFKETFGGLAFLDFTDLLKGAKAKEVAGKLKAWTAQVSKVLLAKIMKKLEERGVEKSAVKEIGEELEKARGLGTAFVSGGMVELEDEKSGLSSPALVLESNTLAMPVKTALGKSGYVPTPTSVNRQMVQSKVPLKTIVLGIIDKQLQRQPIDEETAKKLEAIKKEIETFDPKKYESSGGDRSVQLESAKKTYEQFCKLAGHREEHVGLLVRPIIKLFDGAKLFEGKLPAFALRQLETHLLDAIFDAEDVVALQRSVQNLHEFALYALELGEDKPPSPSSLQLPEGAQTPHLTHYGLNAFSHAFEGVLKQHKQDGGDQLQIAALNNIYFEMMQKLGYTQGASGNKLELLKPSSAEELVKGLPSKSSSVKVKVQGPSLIVLDIDPNDAAKKEIHENEVADLLHEMFASVDKSFRCTVLVDITLNHISEDEVFNIRNEATPYINSGQLNLVFNQSLTKFAQFGTDKHSGGLMFHYNDGKSWKAFNEHVEKCAKEDSVDPTIQKYFMALFEHTEKENLEYLKKVRKNSRYVYEQLQEQFQSIECSEALSLAVNDDPRTCYVAFNYEAFAAQLFGSTPDESEVRLMAHDILFECINELAGKLELPLNMRTSFGFPISNLGDIDPGIRLTVGIESSELLDTYVKILTFTNGALGRELDSNGSGKLKDPEARKQFLQEIAESVKTLDDLDKQISELQKGNGAKQTMVPLTKKKDVVKPKTSTSLQGEKIDVGIGSVEHIHNSCYIASLLNLFAASPAYRLLLETNLPPKPLHEEEQQKPTQAQELAGKLQRAITELRQSDGRVTGEMVEEIREVMFEMGFLQEPDVGGSEKDKDQKKASKSETVNSPQDAAEILAKILGALTVPSSMKLGEQGRKKQDMDNDFVDHQEVQGSCMIQLPIASHGIKTLEEALTRYCAEEDVDNFGLKLISFKALPKTLTFALKRFDFEHYQAKKNYRRLTVPQEFTIPKACLHPSISDQVVSYKVVSCVEHEGGFGGGHYISHAKHEDGRSYRNNDQESGPRKESEEEFDQSLARSYLYVFQQVEL